MQALSTQSQGFSKHEKPRGRVMVACARGGVRPTKSRVCLMHQVDRFAQHPLCAGLREKKRFFRVNKRAP